MASDEFRRFLRLVKEARGDTGAFDVVAMRGRLDRMGGRLPDGTELHRGEIAGVPVGRVVPDGADPGATVLYLHGGGYVAGSVRSHLGLVGHLAAGIGCEVVVPEYRLAPEHPYPAALTDALAVYVGLTDEGADPERMAVMGDSAGGGLTASLLIALRDRGHELPAISVLISPWLDLAGESPSRVTRADLDPLVTMEETELMAASYLAGADPRTPSASPVYADLAGLPPLLVQVGDAEILLDDSVRFVERVRMFGGEAALEVWPEMVHVWHASAGHVPESDEAMAAIASAVRPRLGVGPR